MREQVNQSFGVSGVDSDTRYREANANLRERTDGSGGIGEKFYDHFRPVSAAQSSRCNSDLTPNPKDCA